MVLSLSQPTFSIPQLREMVAGPVLTPGDPGYDAGRTVFYGGIDRYPAAIVRVTGAGDVARVVTYAAETGADLAVRGGGHGLAGHAAVDGGIVLDLAELQDLRIDPERRTAWAGAGLTAGRYTAAADAHGLATGFGDTGSVGIGGITLGGGVGYLSRKYGLTIDHLLAAEIVTGDGRVRYVDAENDPDLFWAIRGGGGNFGVVTRFLYRLHDVGQVLGGMLILPATPEVIHGFAGEAEAAPEDLSTIANIMPAPPMPFIPEEQRGKPVLMAMMVYAGDLEAGRAVLARFRGLATPIVDMVRPMRYPEMFEPVPEGYHPKGVVRTMFLDAVDRAAAETIVEHLRASTAMMAVAQVRILGGAVARVAEDATAYAHRSRAVMVNLAAMYEQTEEAAVHQAWVQRFAAALDQGVAGAYVNFLADEGEARVREAYPGETWNRLVAIKARYDPENLFRVNQNIPPAE